MAKKKTFAEDLSAGNPAMQFISVPQQEFAASDNGSPRFAGRQQHVEPKTKRVQLVMQPSLYAKLAEKAEREQLSINSLIHFLIEDYVKGD